MIPERQSETVASPGAEGRQAEPPRAGDTPPPRDEELRPELARLLDRSLERHAKAYERLAGR